MRVLLIMTERLPITWWRLSALKKQGMRARCHRNWLCNRHWHRRCATARTPINVPACTASLTSILSNCTVKRFRTITSLTPQLRLTWSANFWMTRLRWRYSSTPTPAAWGRARACVRRGTRRLPRITKRPSAASSPSTNRSMAAVLRRSQKSSARSSSRQSLPTKQRLYCRRRKTCACCGCWRIRSPPWRGMCATPAQNRSLCRNATSRWLPPMTCRWWPNASQLMMNSTPCSLAGGWLSTWRVTLLSTVVPAPRWVLARAKWAAWIPAASPCGKPERQGCHSTVA